MRILVLSLLRAGDLIATLPALSQLRAGYPSAEINLVLNRSSESVASLVGSVDQVFYFERDVLQAGLVEANRPLFESYDLLVDFVNELRSHRYDLVVNFTHNRLSGWIAGLIGAQKTIGLSLGEGGRVSFGSNWFKHLNTQVDADDEWAFNHTDIFLGAVGGFSRTHESTDPSLDRFALDRTADRHSSSDFFPCAICETESGEREAVEVISVIDSWSDSNKLVVAVQISTSDPKKDYGDEKWSKLMASLIKTQPELRFVVLGAPFEISRVMRVVQSHQELEWRERVIPAISSFEALPGILDRCRAIFTGDTAVKHLACALSVPVLEVAVGSADPHRTGAWRPRDVIVQTKELCSPCVHSQSCHRDQHYCSINLEINELKQVCSIFLEALEFPGGMTLSSLALRKPFVGFKVYQVWRCNRLSHLVRSELPITEREVFRFIDRYARFASLERLGRGSASEVESFLVDEIEALIEFCQNGVGDQETAYIFSAIRERVAFIRGQIQFIERAYLPASRALKQSAQSETGTMDSVHSELRTLRQVIARSRLAVSQNAIGHAFTDLLTHLSEDGRPGLSPFGYLRKVKEGMSDTLIRLKILTALCDALEDRFLQRAEHKSIRNIHSSSSGGQN